MHIIEPWDQARSSPNSGAGFSRGTGDAVGDLLADDFVLEWPNARVHIRGREYWVEERYEKPAADRSRWFEPM